MKEQLRSNFTQLKKHDEQLLRLGLLAERYFPDDPNTSLLKLRQFAELLAQHVAANVGVPLEEKQFELIQRLEDHGILNRELARLFTDVRRAGNDANHAFMGDRGEGSLGHLRLRDLRYAAEPDGAEPGRVDGRQRGRHAGSEGNGKAKQLRGSGTPLPQPPKRPHTLPAPDPASLPGTGALAPLLLQVPRVHGKRQRSPCGPSTPHR